MSVHEVNIDGQITGPEEVVDALVVAATMTGLWQPVKRITCKHDGSEAEVHLTYRVMNERPNDVIHEARLWMELITLAQKFKLHTTWKVTRA